MNMKNNKKLLSAVSILAIVSVASGCATTSSQVVETPKVNTYNTQYTGEKKKLVVVNSLTVQVFKMVFSLTAKIV